LLTVLVKSIGNTILWPKTIANTNTNTVAEKY